MDNLYEIGTNSAGTQDWLERSRDMHVSSIPCIEINNIVLAYQRENRELGDVVAGMRSRVAEVVNAVEHSET